MHILPRILILAAGLGVAHPVLASSQDPPAAGVSIAEDGSRINAIQSMITGLGRSFVTAHLRGRDIPEARDRLVAAIDQQMQGIRDVLKTRRESLPEAVQLIDRLAAVRQETLKVDGILSMSPWWEAVSHAFLAADQLRGRL